MAKPKVLLLGATGETGGSVLDGLIEYGQDHIIALVRPASVNKPKVAELKKQGIEIRIGDATDPIEKLVEIFEGVDIFISTIVSGSQVEQLSLVEAAKKAGVKRFIPCGFITVCPAGGVMKLRDDKEIVYNHIRVLKLPYTFIDCGYWYQISFPWLPSGRLDDKLLFKNTLIEGDGKVKSGITDLRDIGKYVARIIHDERTLNKFVYFFGDVTSQEENFKLLEELSGEKLTPQYVSQEQLESTIAESKQLIQAEGPIRKHRLNLSRAEYSYSKFVRGDNIPENAKYLGYLDARELYPDFKPMGWKEFLVDLLAGKTKRPYAEGLALE